MLLSVFFALMVGSPTHPPHLARVVFPPTHPTGQCLAPPPPRVADCTLRLYHSTASPAANVMQTLSIGSRLPGCTCPAPG